MIELVGQTVSTKTHGDMLIASVHPWADAFPTVRIWSISDRGLVVPVVLTPAGELVDGRSRAVSCVEAGIPIQGVVKDLTPEQARQLIVDFNVDRRALNKSQIALVAAKISVSDIELTQETIAAMFGVKQSRVSEATTIIEHSRSNAFQVLCGNMTFETALKKARDARPQRVARPPFPPAPISPHEEPAPEPEAEPAPEPEAEPAPEPEAEPAPEPEAVRESEPEAEPVESPVLKPVPPAISGPQTLTLAGWSAASRALLRQLETEDDIFVAGERHKQQVLDEAQARRQAGGSR